MLSPSTSARAIAAYVAAERARRSVRDQCGADHQREAEREHHDRVRVDEFRGGSAASSMVATRRPRDHHDRDVLGHADGRDDAVEQTRCRHRICAMADEETDRGLLADQHVRRGIRIDALVDLGRRLQTRKSPRRSGSGRATKPWPNASKSGVVSRTMIAIVPSSARRRISAARCRCAVPGCGAPPAACWSGSK